MDSCTRRAGYPNSHEQTNIDRGSPGNQHNLFLTLHTCSFRNTPHDAISPLIHKQNNERRPRGVGTHTSILYNKIKNDERRLSEASRESALTGQQSRCGYRVASEPSQWLPSLTPAHEQALARVTFLDPKTPECMPARIPVAYNSSLPKQTERSAAAGHARASPACPMV